MRICLLKPARTASLWHLAETVRRIRAEQPNIIIDKLPLLLLFLSPCPILPLL